MTDSEIPDERTWAADKRDFVADRRDDIADQRDRIADRRDATAERRDRLADAREAALDQWERRLVAQADENGRAPEDSQEECDQAADARAQARRAREGQSLERDRAATERETASGAREEATKRREAATERTGLAMAFAQIARHLYEADTFDDVLSRITAAAVSAVTGCDLASVTIEEDGNYRTTAATDPAAVAVDQAQYDAGEGPCLEAAERPMVYAPTFPDQRWPALQSRPTESGVQSAVSYRLEAWGTATDSSPAGSLNSYAFGVDAFDSEAQEIGLILAAHASVAARAVGERTAVEELGHQLHEALLTRDVISQAKGILMERLHISPEEAFDALRRSSQRLNLKLRQIAENLTETGAFSDDDRPS